MGTDRNTVKMDVGTVYRKKDGGSYFFRYQVNGERKAVSLKTRNRKEAVARAREMMPVVQAPSVEVVAAHVNQARNWAKKRSRLELARAWEVYDRHPDRAHPATVMVYGHYRTHFGDFAKWAIAEGHVYLDEITDEVAARYADAMKSAGISVDTHNKRIRRIGHVFRVLKDYAAETTSDWRNPAFRRRPREENGIAARRLPFSREQEGRIFALLDDPAYECPHKAELRVLFALGAYTGQRLKDCVLLQWHKVDLDGRRIFVRQYKTGKEIVVPIAPQLLDALAGMAANGREGYVLPELAPAYARRNTGGAQVGGGTVNRLVGDVIRRSGLQPCVKVPGRQKAVTVYGFHSLRHSFVSFCIEHNVPRAVAVSILGADSGILDRHYTHVGEAAQEQAIQLISGNRSTVAQRYDRAVEYIASIPEAERNDRLREIERILRG